jgi:hypothetical protein
MAYGFGSRRKPTCCWLSHSPSMPSVTCCRFLRFTLTVEPDRGPIALELTGPRGTREFLESLLDASGQR